jgi:hypothetical protein
LIKLGLSFFLILFVSQVQAATLLRPAFDTQRVFRIGAAQDASSLGVSGVDAYLFEKAALKCGRSKSDLSAQLQDLIERSNSPVISSLQDLFPKFAIRDLKGMQILFDSFGSLISAFRSFYIPAQQNLKATISLDCSRESRYLVPSLLGHELVHHLNQGRNISPWIDEMLAQIIEVRINGEFPLNRYDVLARATQVPSFFARDKTFKSTQEYAINALFGSYISQNFGGVEFLGSLPAGTRSLSDFTRALKKFTTGRGEYNWIRDYLDPQSLIRHFVLALNVNLSGVNGSSIFQVPGWNGFPRETVVTSPGIFALEPGGFLRVSSKWSEKLQSLANAAPLEVYRVLKSSVQFKIQNLPEPVNEEWEENTLVVINTSETEYFEIQLK